MFNVGRPIPPRDYIIFAGDLLLDTPSSTSQSSNITRYVNHPGFAHDFRNDISVIFLTTPFTANSAIAPISMANGEVAANTQCQVTGWGSMEFVRIHILKIRFSDF